MHEYGIACEIVRIAAAEAAKRGAARVTEVRVLVGVLRGVVPEHLVFMFGHAAKGTAADGARLVVEEDPVRIACGSCGPSEAGEFTLVCPACRKPPLSVAGGDALRIASVTIDEP